MPKGDKLTKKQEDFLGPRKRPMPGQRFYVYALIDPRSGKPFYIGKGTGHRIKKHVAEWRNWDGESEVHNWAKLDLIDSIHEAGLEVEERILRDGLTSANAFRIEGHLIRWLRPCLTNAVEGQYCKWQLALDQLRAGMRRIMTPKQYVLSILRRHGRAPNEMERNGYRSIIRELQETEAYFKQKMQEIRAQRLCPR